MNPDFPPGYDPFMWWLDRESNMRFIHDEPDALGYGDLKAGYLADAWWRGVYFDIL